MDGKLQRAERRRSNPPFGTNGVAPSPEPPPGSSFDILKVWRIAVVHIGISPEYFWTLTPFEFFELYDAYIERLEIEDARFAQLAAILANANRNQKKRKKPFTQAEFMPDRRGKRKAEPKKKQTWQEQLEIAKALTLAFGGKLKEGMSAPSQDLVRELMKGE